VSEPAAGGKGVGPEPFSAEGDVNTSPARAAWAARHIDAETQAWLDRDAAAYLHQSLSTPCLNFVDASDGATLTDHQGRQILDFHGNAVNQVGYGHPKVVAAIKEALDTLPFAPRRYTNRPAVELAEELIRLAPAPLGKVLLAPSGAAAISMALKLARYATGRHKMLSMWDAFHGANLDTISVGGEAIFRRDVGPLLPGTEHVPPPGLARRFFGDDDSAPDRLADYIDYVFEVQGDVAALLAEPMRWTTVDPPPPGFWAKVRASCDRHGVKLIFDEIPSALGRTGSMFVCEQVGAVPDMLVIGKGLGGGIMPMAALIARPDLDIVGDRALGHYTHEKSPVGSAAALATLKLIQEEGLADRAARLGRAALDRLTASVGSHQLVTDVRGMGLYLGIELTGNEAANAVLYRSLEMGLSFKVGGGSVLTLCPPLNIEENQLFQGLQMVEKAILER